MEGPFAESVCRFTVTWSTSVGGKQAGLDLHSEHETKGMRGCKWCSSTAHTSVVEDRAGQGD
jgi:hypothetical protein